MNHSSKSNIQSHQRMIHSNLPNKIFSISKINKKTSFSNQTSNQNEAKGQGYVYYNGKSHSIKLEELKKYTFKSVKKENIHKKIIRKFRNFIKTKAKSLENQADFVKDYANNSLFPPFTYKTQSFKSFNSSYMIWLFSNQEIYQLYEEYISKNHEEIYDFLIKSLKIHDKNDQFLVSDYIVNIYKIYSKHSHLLSLIPNANDNTNHSDVNIYKNIYSKEGEVYSDLHSNTYSLYDVYILKNKDKDNEIAQSNLNTHEIFDDIFVSIPK